MHLATYSTIMPVYANLFGICTASIEETRTNKGASSSNLANTEVQPMGRQRIRPCALKDLKVLKSLETLKTLEALKSLKSLESLKSLKTLKSLETLKKKK